MNVFTITVPGLPARCQYCGHAADVWPLNVLNGQLVVACPECHSRIGTVAAVSDGAP